MSHARLWWLFLATGTAATGGYFLLPTGGLAQNLAYNVIGLVSALAILVAVRLHRPERPAMWYWFAAGQIVWVSATSSTSTTSTSCTQSPYPVSGRRVLPQRVPDVGGRSRAAGPRPARPRPRRPGRRRDRGHRPRPGALGLRAAPDRGGLHHLARSNGSSAPPIPAIDAMLLALLARLFTGAGTPHAQHPAARCRRPAAARGRRRVLAAHAVLRLRGGVLDAGWLLSYVTWAAAALHPSHAPVRHGAASPRAAPRGPRPARAARRQLAAGARPCCSFPASGADAVNQRRDRRSARWCCSCSWCCGWPGSWRRCSGRPASSRTWPCRTT